MKYLCLLLTFFLSSCSLFKKEEVAPREVKKIPQRSIIGRIASVSDKQGFVLIQKYGPGRLSKNMLFQAHGADGAQANLRPTGERVRDFFAADLISGKASLGDVVTGLKIRREKPQSTPAEPENSEIPSPAPAEEAQGEFKKLSE